MAERATLVTELRVDDQLTGKLGAAKAQLTQLDATARQAGASVGGLGSSLSGVAKAGATAFVAFKALDVASDFLTGSISKASSLNETMSRSAVIFREDAAAVEAWGKTTAQAFGQSQQQAIDARATFGNLFQTMGIGRQDVLDMSKSVVELASDLASFKDIGVDEALLKLRAGLVGEAEPLRTLGVLLNETTVRQKAQQLGLVQGNAVISESAKVQARYALILEQTKTAQGDFARTSEGLANSQRKLDAALGDLQARIGTGLLPVVTEAVQGLNKIISVDLPSFAEHSAREIDALADALKPVARTADVVSESFQEIAKGARDAIGAARDLAGLGGVGQDFVDVAAQAKIAGDRIAAWTQRERDATQAAITLGAATVALTADIEAGAAAMLVARGKTLEAAKAAAELAKWEAIAGDSAAEANNNLLDFASGANTAANEANDAATAAKELQAELAAIERNITIDILYRVSTAPFINPRAAPGTADADRRNAFSSGGDADALKQANDNFLLRDRLAKEAAAREQAIREAAAGRASAAADQRLSEAKRRANEEATAYEKALGKAFDNAKRTANSLFDTLHSRHVQAIRDAETLAEKQHSGALQLISDTLKAQLAVNAGPVSAAQAALNERQQAQGRRGLVESLSAAQVAVQSNTDPEAAAGLARSLRDATEALENFDDAAKIARLTTVQGTEDAKAQQVADAATLKADAALTAAKAQAQKDLDAETVAAFSKKDFENALAKLEAADLKAKKSPAEQKADIAKLEERFGITTDPITGFHHITDPLITAIKNIPPSVVNVTFNPVFNAVFQVSARAVAAALASQSSPTSTPMVRTGAAGRS